MSAAAAATVSGTAVGLNQRMTSTITVNATSDDAADNRHMLISLVNTSVRVPRALICVCTVHYSVDRVNQRPSAIYTLYGCVGVGVCVCGWVLISVKCTNYKHPVALIQMFTSSPPK